VAFLGLAIAGVLFVFTYEPFGAFPHGARLRLEDSNDNFFLFAGFAFPNFRAARIKSK
jgi:hypothetical protein